jgi:hypothetical protein
MNPGYATDDLYSPKKKKNYYYAQRKSVFLCINKLQYLDFTPSDIFPISYNIFKNFIQCIN